MSAAQQIIPAVPAETKTEIASLADLALQSSQLVITSQTEYQNAADLLADIKRRGKALEEKRKAITAPLDAAKKAAMDMFRPAVDAIDAFEKSVKDKMAGFVREQERIRRETEAAAAEKARKEQEKLLAQAEKAAAAGKLEKAEALELQAASTVAVTPAIEAPVAAGAHARRVWKARLTDKMALIQAVADGRASPELLDFNQSVGNGLAKALKSGMNIPGLESYEDISIAAR